MTKSDAAGEDLDFNVGLVAVTLFAEELEHEGVPTSAGRGGEPAVGRMRYAEFSTPDGLAMRAGFIRWPDGSADVQPLDFLAGPDAYRRLEGAGRLTLSDSGAGSLVGLLRAMKFSAGRQYQTLASVGWPELDALAGSDATELLRSHGAMRVGSYVELKPEAKRFRDDPAFEIDEDGAEAVFTAFAITRVAAIQQSFGKRGVQVLHA